MPDGIITAPELGSLIAQERAVWVQTQFAVLVATVSRLTGVPAGSLLVASSRKTFAQQDARRIAINLTAEWLKGVWSDVDLAHLWHTWPTTIQYARRVHANYLETDPLYRELTVKIRAALEAERPALEARV